MCRTHVIDIQLTLLSFRVKDFKRINHTDWFKETAYEFER